MSRLCDVRRTEAATPELTSPMLGNCDWEGCVIAAATNSAKSRWAISDPAWSKIMTAILSRPLGLDEIAEGVELEIGGEHAGHLSSQRGADRDHRAPMLKER